MRISSFILVSMETIVEFFSDVGKIQKIFKELAQTLKS